jgi:hypothetical protein
MFTYEPNRTPGISGGTVKLVLSIVVVALAALLVLGAGFWLLGIVFGMLGWIVRIALLAAVAAFVWRLVTRRRARSVV